MKAVLYARVSDPKIQDTDDKVSIDQQLADMRKLCERNGWVILQEFVDREYYIATQAPNKGKMVNPSGERTDRPQFLAMLEVVKTGEVQKVLCWRDDRLVRHPRVAVVLEDALDIGDAQRNGNGKVEIHDATGAIIDRFTLSIKATIWREENKRRAERTKMGKIATLQQGRWPGSYDRLGYKTIREEDKRGQKIALANESEVQTVKDIFHWYDSGVPLAKIRRYLIAQGAEQRGRSHLEHEWDKSFIYQILHSESYTGKLTWRFSDKTEYTIEIPQIIPADLWQRVQKRLDHNKILSTRNAKGVYLLQGLVFCGECDGKLGVVSVRHSIRTLTDGTKRYYKRFHDFQYRCKRAHRYPDEPHPQPWNWSGVKLDWEVWRRVVDYSIKQPHLVREQIQNHQDELWAQGDNVEGEIAHAYHKISEIDSQRTFYQRQAARGKITEVEFDTRMNETEETRRYWQSELEQLKELRDDQAKVQAGLDYATELLTTLQDRLADIDIPLEEMRKLSEERRSEILKERQQIIRALVDKVVVYSSGQVKVEGVLDGSEAAQFGLGRP